MRLRTIIKLNNTVQVHALTDHFRQGIAIEGPDASARRDAEASSDEICAGPLRRLNGREVGGIAAIVELVWRLTIR